MDCVEDNTGERIVGVPVGINVGCGVGVVLGVTYVTVVVDTDVGEKVEGR
jgi:hypothetical protein